MGPSPKRADAGLTPASLTKRMKPILGEELVVTHTAPRAKRFFADMYGIVETAAGSTVDLRFKVPKPSAPLFSDFLGTAEEAVVRFSLAHVARERQPTASSPFQSTAVQRHLAALLGPKALINLYATARGAVEGWSLGACLAASLRRVLTRPPAEGQDAIVELAQTKREWSRWKTGTYLKGRAYARVRDALLDLIVVKTPDGDAINARAMPLVSHLGARYDPALIRKLFLVKGALVRQRFCELQSDEQLRPLLGEGGRGKQRPRSLYAYHNGVGCCALGMAR